jgi:hypothetical protein
MKKPKKNQKYEELDINSPSVRQTEEKPEPEPSI